MSEPEIARRCKSCGASIRVRAFFCPQCGKVLPSKDDRRGNSQQVEEEMVVAAELQSIEDASEPLGGKELESENWEAINVAAASESAVVHTPPVPAGRVRVQRAGRVVSAVVEEDAIHGVEKLRQISSAVLDEASYDPSLRFVLVAAVLFIVFVVLLVLSELLN